MACRISISTIELPDAADGIQAPAECIKIAEIMVDPALAAPPWHPTPRLVSHRKKLLPSSQQSKEGSMDGSQHWASDRQSSVSDSLSHFPFFFHFVRCSCPSTTSSASSPRGKKVHLDSAEPRTSSSSRYIWNRITFSCTVCRLCHTSASFQRLTFPQHYLGAPGSCPLDPCFAFCVVYMRLRIMPLPPPKTPRIGLIYIHSLHRGLSPVSRAAFSTSMRQESEPDLVWQEKLHHIFFS
ncbi:uncharacterized protein B0T23DRAFT_377827 [Neurospora hispaniola]|uniref:Uncharacterized protein n=1 Tax=Neurospora hispaniola TaxID=588809 RepID=A0AAJ0IAI8_9PEZI|nr:hypothetical protein B0T23DRAFT_377827 [Neurospora hispaniola]